MKKALAFAAAIFAASPALADVWVDQECETVVLLENSTFILLANGGYHFCHIDDWPLRSATARILCTDGVELTLTSSQTRMMEFDGRQLNLYEGPLPCGFNGAEWPD